MSLKKKLLCSVAVATVAIPLSVSNVTSSAKAESCYSIGNSIYLMPPYCIQEKVLKQSYEKLIEILQ